MPDLSRRNLIRGAAAVTGAPVVSSVTPATGALAGTAAKRGRYGDIRDIKHVVILMQENRSFDHYFGSLRGVRGFGDRSTITLPGGYPVWQQPASAPGQPVTGTLYPWRLSTGTFAGTQPPSPETGAQNYGGTDHSWETQHGAWNGGLMNAWYHAKGGPTTLGYLNRQDIPFHYALADAYTIGDAYHCSVLSATGPNRTFLWSGTINADQEHGSYVAYSGGDELGKFLSWPSYPETLQAAGVSWKIYQGSDNYGDNGAEYFATFAKYDPGQAGTPAPGVAWYDNGVATVPEPYPAEDGNGDNLALAIRKDVLAGTLPQVSWVVTNQQYSEHPDGAPHDGAYYIDQVLKSLNADPDVFDSTLVVIDFDENDGQFDHVPPPVPVAGTADEFYLETSLAPEPLPVGLGFRVPLLLISPWTRGGWVTSEVSDHTSVIQFLEKWTAAMGKPAVCPNISAWRRSVCGDLTGAFDFAHPVFGLPDLPGPSASPPTRTTRSRPAARCRCRRPGPSRPGRCPASRTPTSTGLTIVGPNRFLRHFTGDTTAGVTAQVTARYYQGGFGRAPRLMLELATGGAGAVTFTVTQNHYSKEPARSYRVRADGSATYVADPLAASDGWYDVSVTISGDQSWSRRYAGHLEDGRASVTG